MANKKDPAENRQDLLQIGIMSLWVQYSTRNMGLPSAKRKSDKTQIGLFIGSEVFHFDGDYDIIKQKYVQIKVCNVSKKGVFLL